MKKLISLFTVLSLTAVLGSFSSCSSAPSQSESETAGFDPSQIEPDAQNDAFTALTADTSPVQDTGAVQDTSPPTYLADASQATGSTASDTPSYTPSYSPVDLGASSAGRAH